MSSKRSNQNELKSQYVQKIKLNNSKRVRKRPPKLCPDCKDTSNCVKTFSDKVSKFEKIIDKFKNLPKREVDKISKFNAKFKLNNIPCEVEYDLSQFTLENLQKLANFMIPPSIASDKNDETIKEN
ncbi:hypothetical protein RhiirA5_495027 [Rhizophagus irregularis]|uniref:Uncharacterized protein n=3 Tax=Rhizophagus irregularis TaxID=588596 RepID=A0A2I1ENC8_9GLOM|nr:hypothetical protein RirG_218450 [Rhizophagus irregularis DAOM 197198w]PKC14869.1 hypothetical protein RhiirA5_495027 [Rhizophagus irregularis]RGB41203.1 hypothetical protein C1646_752376 [Rhizophagus diaphanus] [Rhizophagus sp. MUCL 43196]GBC36736.1 hypothetical protein GLOIN_2v1782086 [Rhizophagus irregularis DAOM 181602=DAOM 197198]PKK60991.1 hypothetical protein RhiirC2_856522 [Rhizophagus irregularis]